MHKVWIRDESGAQVIETGRILSYTLHENDGHPYLFLAMEPPLLQKDCPVRIFGARWIKEALETFLEFNVINSMECKRMKDKVKEMGSPVEIDEVSLDSVPEKDPKAPCDFVRDKGSWNELPKKEKKWWQI